MILLLIILFLATSYLRVEVVDAPNNRSIDTLTYIKTDTATTKDTARIPIQFDVNIEDWEESNISL